ncbi:MAG: SDR family NAD(P)-dependent oxidoreductase [Clostridiaceae bacterium]|nr:SDR family NAD(P)-dependent oxidoreductase [Clostridiaceae bacterium]
MPESVLVTGGTSGIGLETARELSRRGCIVYTLSRRGSQEPGMTHLLGDVTDEASVSAAVNQIVSERGALNVLVCCAGFGVSGAVEYTPLADAKAQVDVNLFGTVNCCRMSLPALRKSRGRIVNISSVAAPVAIPFQAYYSVSKAGINAFSLALANEVRPFGITVCCVMPGDIKTGFTAARKKDHTGDDIYGGRIARSVAVMERDEQNGMSAAAAGRYVANRALKKRCPPLCTIGASYKLLVFLTRLLPVRLVNRLVYMLYAK